jgi:hypothetical protein
MELVMGLLTGLPLVDQWMDLSIENRIDIIRDQLMDKFLEQLIDELVDQMKDK